MMAIFIMDNYVMSSEGNFVWPQKNSHSVKNFMYHRQDLWHSEGSILPEKGWCQKMWSQRFSPKHHSGDICCKKGKIMSFNHLGVVYNTNSVWFSTKALN